MRHFHQQMFYIYQNHPFLCDHQIVIHTDLLVGRLIHFKSVFVQDGHLGGNSEIIVRVLDRDVEDLEDQG